ncbi:MAG: DUF4173 domain-containing protein [Actinobacteria bacterium]|nr:DUF4173 domain-containing protein [Actinomycetota bacterium]
MWILPAYLAALLAAIGVPDQQPGVNVFVVWGLVVVVMWKAAGRSIGLVDRLFIVASLIPVSLVAVLSAEWVVAMELAAGLGVAAVGVSRSGTWTEITTASTQIVRGLRRGLLVPLKPVTASFPHVSERIKTSLRGIVLTGALVALFGGLLLSADRAFATLAEDWLVLDFRLDLIAARVVMGVVTLAGAGSLALLAPSFREDPPATLAAPNEEPHRGLLQPREWKMALIVLNVIFGLFVAVQLTVLFGGHSHVLTTAGLTYAEYAREGFFQLLAVAVLTLGLIAWVANSCRSDADRRWAKVLLGILCLLTLVIIASAFKRMNLYEDAFGATRLRLTVDLAIRALAAMFCLVLLAVVRWNGRWLPRGAIAICLVAVVGFGLSNPDARIAETNVGRFEETGEIDLSYLRTLSTDALPALLELPELERHCAVGPILARVDEEPAPWAFNLSSESARDVLEDDPPPPCSPSVWP